MPVLRAILRQLFLVFAFALMAPAVSIAGCITALQGA